MVWDLAFGLRIEGFGFLQSSQLSHCKQANILQTYACPERIESSACGRPKTHTLKSGFLFWSDLRASVSVNDLHEDICVSSPAYSGVLSSYRPRMCWTSLVPLRSCQYCYSGTVSSLKTGSLSAFFTTNGRPRSAAQVRDRRRLQDASGSDGLAVWFRVGLRVSGSGFRVQGVGYRASVKGFRVLHSMCNPSEL